MWQNSTDDKDVLREFKKLKSEVKKDFIHRKESNTKLKLSISKLNLHLGRISLLYFTILFIKYLLARFGLYTASTTNTTGMVVQSIATSSTAGAVAIVSTATVGGILIGTNVDKNLKNQNITSQEIQINEQYNITPYKEADKEFIELIKGIKEEIKEIQKEQKEEIEKPVVINTPKIKLYQITFVSQDTIIGEIISEDDEIYIIKVDNKNQTYKKELIQQIEELNQ